MSRMVLRRVVERHPSPAAIHQVRGARDNRLNEGLIARIEGLIMALQHRQNRVQELDFFLVVGIIQPLGLHEHRSNAPLMASRRSGAASDPMARTAEYCCTRPRACRCWCRLEA